MSTENERREQELRIQRQIAFASGLFQGDVTVRTLLESLAEGIVIIDSSGTILLINAAAERMFCYQKEDLIGRPHAVLLPEGALKVHEEHEAGFFTEPRIRPMGQLHDLAGRRSDGSEFPVEISLGFIETINGVLVLALVSDMTLRKQFETRLKESEELFHIQVECVKDHAVFMLDKEGNVLNWNVGAERLKGYQENEIIGKHYSCFYPVEERTAGKPAEMLKKAVTEGRAADEGWRIRKDGSRFWADVMITAIPDEKGNLRGFSKVTRDITGRKKTEDALRFSEERYRTLFRDNPTMIVTLDADLTMLSVNPTCACQLGYTIDELEGRSVLMLFHEDDRPAVAEQLQRCLQNPDQVHRWQFRKIRKDGGLVWVEEISQAVYDLNGTLNLLVVCQDVTERKQAEEALRESEQRFASFMLHLPAAAWMKDLHGRYVYANVEAEHAFSTPLSALRDKTDDEVFPVETARQFRENDERVLAGEGSLQTTEVLRQADGIEHQSIVSKFAVPGPDGQPAYVAGVALDITERMQAEDALRKSELKFSTVFHSVPALLAISTLEEGRIIDVNATSLRTLGYRREEMVDRTALELGVWESKAERDRAIRMVEEHGAVHDLEITFRGKNGKAFNGLFSAELVDFNGDRYMLSMVNDITERKQMEEEIERLNADLAARAAELEGANQELEAFNYTVAHDLRRPLAVVNGYCQALSEICGDKLDETCRDYLQEAYAGTLRMNRLIDALLNFSHLLDVKPHRETVDLSGVAQELAVELAQAEPARRVEFLITEGISVTGDTNLLRVVMENLLGNAWKYTGNQEEAVIKFGVTTVGEETAYFVSDNGPGFDMADAEKLFVPFQRVAGQKEFAGHGIGLATVERIIRRHGGRVWAEGEPGKGATFCFTLQSREIK